MTFTQKFFLCILPRKWGENLRAESRAWILRCPCGYEQSWWEAGGIRWRAAGHARRLMQCPRCGKTTWHVTYLVDNQDSEIRNGD